MIHDQKVFVKVWFGPILTHPCLSSSLFCKVAREDVKIVGTLSEKEKPLLLLVWDFSLFVFRHEIAGSSNSLGTIASFNSLRDKGKGTWDSLECLHFCQDVTPQPRLWPEQLAKTLLIQPEAFVMSKNKITVSVKDPRYHSFRF